MSSPACHKLHRAYILCGGDTVTFREIINIKNEGPQTGNQFLGLKQLKLFM